MRDKKNPLSNPRFNLPPPPSLITTSGVAIGAAPVAPTILVGKGRRTDSRFIDPRGECSSSGSSYSWIPILVVAKKATCQQLKVYSRKLLLTVHTTLPTNNALLTNLRLSSDADILLIITGWAYKSASNVQKRVCIVCMFQLSFHFACHPWWLGTVCRILVYWSGDLL